MELSMQGMAVSGIGKNCRFYELFPRAGNSYRLDYRTRTTKINPTLTRIVIGVSRRTGCLQRAARSSPILTQARRAGYLRHSDLAHHRFLHAICQHAQGTVERAGP